MRGIFLFLVLIDTPAFIFEHFFLIDHIFNSYNNTNYFLSFFFPLPQQVRAVYKYVAEDSDELNLDVGDVVRVVEYEDPEEIEIGWLVGIKESTGDKGLFPANFTKAI